MASTSVPQRQLSPGAKRQYVGLIWDEYTPQVEGQLTRDLLALLDTARGLVDEVVVVVDDHRCTRLLDGLGIRSVPTQKLAKMWIVYKTKQEWPEAPDWVDEVVERDLYQAVKPGNMRVPDDSANNGFYLPPQGRLSPDTISLDRPAPNGYVPTDSAALLIWTGF